MSTKETRKNIIQAGRKAVDELIKVAERRKFISTLAIGIATIPFASLIIGMYKGKYNFKVLNYTLEFEEMWVGNFGSQKSDNTPHKYNVAGKQIELYFTPSDQTTSQINKVIQSVDYSFEFGLLSFTRDDLAQTIIDKRI